VAENRQAVSRAQALLELFIWALFIGSQGVSLPVVDWLAVRGAIVWLRREEPECR
jgi:hypothetical protein